MLYDAAFHTQVVWALFVVAAITFTALLLISAPYGRHARGGWGPMIPSRIGWVVMESPSVLVFAAVFWGGDHRAEVVPLVFLALWQLHYFHRTCIFPFRLRSKGKEMPALIALLAFVFTTINAWINALWISHLGSYHASWLSDPRFLVGAALFLAGWAINVHADTVLINLRKPGETGYKVPKGGFYRWISCPNYFGEIVEWIGWAIATWSLAGLAFAVYTAANLAPRAFTHHRWYIETFDDYPEARRALIPYVV